MEPVKFTLDGVDGEFEADADEIRSYRTLKQLAYAQRDVAGMFDAIERIYMGRAEEYVDRAGGMDALGKLNDAAIEAAQAKNSSGSSPASKGTEAK